jgi:hypothetical protein
MESAPAEKRSRALSVLTVVFLALYFLVFSADALRTYFTFDDGMNLIALHRHWAIPIRANLLDVLKVFTPAYRPLGALFYRPLYELFGFNPVPFRVVCHLLMAVNIVLAYRFARVLEATPEAAVLSTLLFAYNGSMGDLYYNTGTIYDLLCFPLYIGAILVYTRDRSRNRHLGWTAMLVVMALFLAALDAKEMAVTLPAALLLYELLYHCREFTHLKHLLRTGGFLVLMFAASAFFLKTKLAVMAAHELYRPRVDVSYIVSGIGHYFEQLWYLKPDSFGAMPAAISIALFVAAGVLLRNRTAVYGILFFTIGLLPVAVIVRRSGYAAYVVYPGLTLALGAILASVRSAVVRVTGKTNLELASRIALFFCVAVVSVKGFAHSRKIAMGNALWDEQRRIDLLTGMKEQIPEFPPGARVLILDDPWEPGWGPMFLARMRYGDPALWMDRVRNLIDTAPKDSYDLLISYKQPLLVPRSPRMLGVRKAWELRWFPYRKGEFVLTGPSADRAIRNINFSASAAAPGERVTVNVPGLGNSRIGAIYRIVSGAGTVTHSVENWCALDSKGSCTISAPNVQHPAKLAVDWVRPSKGRWIFTHGELKIDPQSHGP